MSGTRSAFFEHQRRDTVLLEELLDLVDLTIDRVPNDRDAFLSDLDKRDATALRIQAIGEHMRALSQEFRAAHPELPWRQAFGMRNIIAHDYGELDYEIGFNVVVSGPFTSLRADVARILERHAD